MPKITNIKMPINGIVTTLDIEDAAAYHNLFTYNNGKKFGEVAEGTVKDISLADTPITEKEITDLFTVTA